MTKKNIFDAEKFKRDFYEPLYRKTKAASSSMAYYHRGLANGERELADGYAEGKTLEQIKADLNDRRIKCQMEYRPVNVAAEEAAEAFIAETFKLVPSELGGVSDLMNGVDMTSDELRVLVRENAGSYTALRAIEKYANDRKMGFGTTMSECLGRYRDEVEKHVRGIVETCARGVLEKGWHENWDAAASGRMEWLEAADSELLTDLGVAEHAPDPMQNAFNEYAWRH